jgi:hypothetical protein
MTISSRGLTRVCGSVLKDGLAAGVLGSTEDPLQPAARKRIRIKNIPAGME